MSELTGLRDGSCPRWTVDSACGGAYRSHERAAARRLFLRSVPSATSRSFPSIRAAKAEPREPGLRTRLMWGFRRRREAPTGAARDHAPIVPSRCRREDRATLRVLNPGPRMPASVLNLGTPTSGSPRPGPSQGDSNVCRRYSCRGGSSRCSAALGPATRAPVSRQGPVGLHGAADRARLRDEASLSGRPHPRWQ